MRCYSDRAKALKEIGFEDYAAYLASPLWAGIRKRTLSGSPECFCCFRPADQVHHVDYSVETLKGLTDSLVPICGRCHQASEVRASGQKRTLKLANETMASICMSHGKDPAALMRVAFPSKEDKKGQKKKKSPSSSRRKNRLARAEAYKEIAARFRVYSCVKCGEMFMIDTSIHRGTSPCCQAASPRIKVRQTRCGKMAISQYEAIKMYNSGKNVYKRPDAATSYGASNCDALGRIIE